MSKKKKFDEQLDGQDQKRLILNIISLFRLLLWHTASGAWHVASIANIASKVLSENGIFMKSAWINKKYNPQSPTSVSSYY